MPQNLSDGAHQNLEGNMRRVWLPGDVYKNISGSGTVNKRENKTRLFVLS